jgi:hypothetical protein
MQPHFVFHIGYLIWRVHKTQKHTTSLVSSHYIARYLFFYPETEVASSSLSMVEGVAAEEEKAEKEAVATTMGAVAVAALTKAGQFISLTSAGWKLPSIGTALTRIEVMSPSGSASSNKKQLY